MTTQRKALAALGVTCLLASAHCVQAQTLPDAGSLSQQLERGLIQPLPPVAPPSEPTRVTQPRAPQGLTLEVRGFKFKGNRLLSDQTLAAAVAGFLNRPIGFAQLQEAAVAAATSYRAAGWVVRAYIPEQDFVDGQVTIELVEAVFGKLRQEGPVPRRIPLPLIENIVGTQQRPGEPIKLDAIERATLLVEDLPGITATVRLLEGEQDRSTDLLFKATDRSVLTGDAALDNTGSRSTGAQKVAVNLSANSLLQRGDLLSTNVSASEGSQYLRLGATLPYGGDGLRLGVNASRMEYRVILSDVSQLSPNGSATTYGLDARYPIIRSRLKNLYFTATADDKRYENFSAGIISTAYINQSLTLGLSANTFDAWMGGGTNNVSLNWTTGQINLDGSPNQGADASSTQTAGSYSKLRYAYSRQQAVTGSLSVTAALSGQLASKNLDSSEKFSLGGSSGVRAYPSGEGSGTTGQMLNIDVTWRLPHGLSLTGFYDTGSITINADNSYTGASALNAYTLSGAGLALSRDFEGGRSLKAIWARRIGANPNPTATGMDQDGSKSIDRFWLTASLAF